MSLPSFDAVSIAKVACIISEASANCWSYKSLQVFVVSYSDIRQL